MPLGMFCFTQKVLECYKKRLRNERLHLQLLTMKLNDFNTECYNNNRRSLMETEQSTSDGLMNDLQG